MHGRMPVRNASLDPQPQPQSQPAANEIDALGLHVNHAILTIHQLEGLGLQKLRIPLPKIVVLGKYHCE